MKKTSFFTKSCYYIRMYKKRKYVFVLFVFFLMSFYNIPFADSVGPYTFLEQVNLENPSQSGGATSIKTDPASVGDYINNLYIFVIVVICLISVFMLMRGGIAYLTSNITNDVKRGKEIIVGVISGLVFIFSIYLIFYLVNPRLLTSNFILGKLDSVAQSVGAPSVEKNSPSAVGAIGGSEVGSRESIMSHEGTGGGEVGVYCDTNGKWAFGYGVQADGNSPCTGKQKFDINTYKGSFPKGITKSSFVNGNLTKEAMKESFNIKYTEVSNFVNNKYPNIPPNVTGAIIDLVYNVGKGAITPGSGSSYFKKMDEAIKNKDYCKAAIEFKDSKRSGQVGGRVDYGYASIQKSCVK